MPAVEPFKRQVSATGSGARAGHAVALYAAAGAVLGALAFRPPRARSAVREA